MSFTGQISVLRDNSPWALNLGDTVQPQQVIVTGPDGYGFFRSPMAAVRSVSEVESYFPRQPGRLERPARSLSGQDPGQIEHPGGLPNNNKVRTPSAVISVRGTVFDVEVEDEDGTTMVLDEEGQVEVRHLLKAGEVKVLSPNEYIRVYKDQPIAKKLIDKGGILQRALRTAAEAVYEVAAERSGTPGHGTTGPTLPADHTGGNPPPPPPPPPPAPSTAPPPPPPPSH